MGNFCGDIRGLVRIQIIMKYIHIQNGEYKLKEGTKDFDESIFNEEINHVKETAIIHLDDAIIKMFFTPLALLALTFIPVAITSILVIALGIIMDTFIFYIFLGVAYLLWASLMVIVLVERKAKNKYFKNPTICFAKITSKEYTRKKGYLIEFDLYVDGVISSERLFLKTNLDSKKNNETKRQFCEAIVKENNIFVMVYNDQKRRCFPVKLFKKAEHELINM